MAPRAARLEAWDRLASDLDVAALEAVSTTRPLADAPELAREMLAGQVRGRVVLTVDR
jgi:acrylyl-CoA reductase (NADPH)